MTSARPINHNNHSELCLRNQLLFCSYHIKICIFARFIALNAHLQGKYFLTHVIKVANLFFVDTSGVWLLSVFIEFSSSTRQQAERLWEAVKDRAGPVAAILSLNAQVIDSVLWQKRPDENR